MNPESIRKVAVVGGGVAGIVAAYLLQERFEVSLYERNAYIGGHTNTVIIEDGPDAGTPVDTGFIVFNERTYPNFIRFLGRLGVGRHASGMSFSYHDTATGLAYASASVDSFLAQRANILSPSFWMMALAILRFNHITPRHWNRAASPDSRWGSSSPGTASTGISWNSTSSPSAPRCGRRRTCG
jgi:predicted NAD/FAD-binding protein